MIDCENLFGLLSKRSVVTDVPGSKELVLSQGEVSACVTFQLVAYDCVE
jgi:hypothetical protein